MLLSAFIWVSCKHNTSRLKSDSKIFSSSLFEFMLRSGSKRCLARRFNFGPCSLPPVHLDPGMTESLWVVLRELVLWTITWLWWSLTVSDGSSWAVAVTCVSLWNHISLCLWWGTEQWHTGDFLRSIWVRMDHVAGRWWPPLEHTTMAMGWPLKSGYSPVLRCSDLMGICERDAPFNLDLPLTFFSSTYFRHSLLEAEWKLAAFGLTMAVAGIVAYLTTIGTSTVPSHVLLPWPNLRHLKQCSRFGTGTRT